MRTINEKVRFSTYRSSIATRRWLFLLLFGDIANAGSLLRLHNDTQHTDRPKYLYTKCTPPHFLRWKCKVLVNLYRKCVQIFWSAVNVIFTACDSSNTQTNITWIFPLLWVKLFALRQILSLPKPKIQNLAKPSCVFFVTLRRLKRDKICFILFSKCKFLCKC